jgi:hypothetical protein
MLIPP